MHIVLYCHILTIQVDKQGLHTFRRKLMHLGSYRPPSHSNEHKTLKKSKKNEKPTHIVF